MAEPTSQMTSPADLATAERIRTSPLPTAQTLRRRQNLPVQLLRFARINLRMLKVITAKHS
jgi:hypothetical protein